MWAVLVYNTLVELDVGFSGHSRVMVFLGDVLCCIVEMEVLPEKKKKKKKTLNFQMAITARLMVSLGFKAQYTYT